ncbi:hypothetical protein Syun_017951 [Stephania yunnanensis]|uniref:PRONE domain-containing protein n=1 Tax=Stephania yunnanensis TaxID=152371 RepID=A0AAP0IRI2_9MAGN
MTYNGLESCILNSCPYDNESSTSRAEGFATDSLDENDSVCSSSKDAFGSFSSGWLVNKEDYHDPDEWKEGIPSPKKKFIKEKLIEVTQVADVETMKERFAKLLLGDDVTGGKQGLTTALALSKSITNLAASVFGELWKLEPLPNERKSIWRREMNWLLSPTNYMVELVPAKQIGINGQALEIMTPKARSDIHLNLPALQKLDSMLIDVLDSMVKTEFWYAEGGSRAEGRNKNARQSKWWLPSPRVPIGGLSVSGRKKLIQQGKVVKQILKAAKSINSNVLNEMPVPTAIRDTLPKSGKANLGEGLRRILSTELTSEEMVASLGLKTEHAALQTMNQLEAAIFVWRHRVSDQVNGKSPIRTSWSFIRDPVSETDKAELLLDRAEGLLELLKFKFPDSPQTFLDVTKVQYNKDVGHSILEAYSRVIGSLAFKILSRMEDILQEDDLSNPNSPVPTCCFSSLYVNASGTPGGSSRIRHSLIDQMNEADGQSFDSKVSSTEKEGKASSLVTLTPSKSRRIWCSGREACRSVSPTTSP